VNSYLANESARRPRQRARSPTVILNPRTFRCRYWVVDPKSLRSVVVAVYRYVAEGQHMIGDNNVGKRMLGQTSRRGTRVPVLRGILSDLAFARRSNLA
jgi:hypothetical protein